MQPVFIENLKKTIEELTLNGEVIWVIVNDQFGAKFYRKDGVLWNQSKNIKDNWGIDKKATRSFWENFLFGVDLQSFVFCQSEQELNDKLFLKEVEK